jgi:hypothetical protein
MADISPLSLLSQQEITGKKPENLYGLEKEDADKYLEAQRGFVKSLEDRYAQPNLWSVAAGFAKPQLGGFMASFGSAAQALGQQAEKQRDIQLPLYRARSELAAYEMGLKQKAKAAGKAEQIVGEKRTPTPTEQMDITSLTEGPTKGAEVGASAQRSQAEQIRAAITSATSFADAVNKLGPQFTMDQFGEFLRNNPSVIPPAGTPEWLLKKPGATTPVGTPAEPTGQPTAQPEKTARGRQPIPGLDVDALTEEQYRNATNDYNTLKQEKYTGLTKEVNQLAQGGRKVFETAQQIHNVASDPALAQIFAQFEKGNPAGIIGQMLESQNLSSTLAEMRKYATSARLGGGDALTKLNKLETLMGTLQTEMQNAVINPTDQRTASEFASLPNLKNSQDAFLRSIRYIANEGLNKYENQFALQKASKTPQFDPNYWNITPAYKDAVRAASVRRDALVRTPATRDLPAFMRGTIDEAAYKGESKGGNKPTAKELRERANKPD